jgi:hypothetical protein
MAQTGFTPILLYASSTPGNIPAASNLTNSASGAETALNYADGRLFYKNASNVVTQLADRTWVGTVTSVSGTGSVNGITLTGTVTSSGNLTLGGTLGNIANSQLTNSTISGVALGGNLFNLTAGTGVSFSAGSTYNGSAAITINATGTGGTVTSVAALTIGTTGTDLSSTVANSTTTPVITLNVPTASATNRGALSAADWTTFNNKAPAFTYTTGYIPFGQGTTTPTQSINFTYDTSNVRLTVGVLGVTANTPDSILTVAKASSSTTIGGSTAIIAVKNTQSSAANETAGIEFFSRSTTGSDKLAGIYGVYAGFNATGYAGDLVFATQAAGATNVTEDMRIFASGGVSIGSTSDPGNTNLYVAGRLNVGINGTSFPSANAKGIIYTTTAQTGFFINVDAASSTANSGLAVRKRDNDNTTAQIYVDFQFNQGLSGSGGIQGNGASGVQFFSSSDARLKENVVELDSQLDKILQLQPKIFDFINGPKNCTGFIAQEFAKIYPDNVNEGSDGFLTIGGVSITETRIIKALQEIVAKLKAAGVEGF